MNSIKFTQLEEALVESNYFKTCLSRILEFTQPAQYCMNLIIKLIIHGPDGCGKRLLAKSVAKHLGMNYVEQNVVDLFYENIIGTEKKTKVVFTRLTASPPCVIYLSGYQLFNQMDDVDVDRIESCISNYFDESDNTQPIVLMAGTNDYNSIFKTELSKMFHYDLNINPATFDQAKELLNKLGSNLSIDCSKALEILDSSLDTDFYIGNLVDIIARGRSTDYYHLSPLICTSKIDPTGAMRKDSICWDDIGGLAHIKKEIIDAFKLSIEYPELKASGLRRNGILLYGPPGTGKTMLAKAAATECNLKFISVKGPELLNEYVGQSEDNVRKLFERARESGSSVIFFDELDSLVPNRGQAGDSGGVMDRIVSQVCAEMDGVGKSGEVFVMGATNRVDLVDPCLLRPGRFDKILAVPRPQTRDERWSILKALTRQLNLNSDVDLEIIESKLPNNLSGADLRQLISVALELAFERAIAEVESGKATEEDVNIEIIMQDFTYGLSRYSPLPGP